MLKVLKELLENYKWSVENQGDSDYWREEILNFVNMQTKSLSYAYVFAFLGGAILTYFIMINL